MNKLVDSQSRIQTIGFVVPLTFSLVLNIIKIKMCQFEEKYSFQSTSAHSAKSVGDMEGVGRGSHAKL